MSDPKTLYYEKVQGAAHVVVHASRDPSDEEWARYLDSITEALDDVKGVFAHSVASAPSAKQRAYASAHWEKVGRTPTISVIAGSRMVRGVVTALSWLIGSKIRAFAPDDFEGAADHLGLTQDDRQRVLASARALAVKAGVSMEGFGSSATARASKEPRSS